MTDPYAVHRSRGRPPAVYLICALLLWIPGGLGAEEEPIRAGESLSLSRCIEIALSREPTILRQRHAAEAGEALVGQARAGYYPQLDVKTGISRYSPVRQTDDPYTSINTMYGYDYGSSTLSLNQKVYDFGKREAQVDVARFNAEAARREWDDQIVSVVHAVRTAYSGVLKARHMLDVNREARELQRRQRNQAQQFFAAGKKPRYDVTSAEVNLSAAELNVIGAEHALAGAQVSLNVAMGYDGAADYTLQDILQPVSQMPSERESVERALADRMDLRALVARQESARWSVELSRKGFLPSVDATMAYDLAGSRLPPAQGWNAGLQFSWNLFSGFSTRKEVDKTSANLREAEARVAALRLQILQEVKKALLSLRKAQEAASHADVQVRQALENLELADLRYQAGLGTSLDVAAAMSALSNARLARITALHDGIVARADLDKAMGSRSWER